jgi:hypothetical protein
MHTLVPNKSCLSHHYIYHCLVQGACIFRKILQWPLSIAYDILLQTNSTLLTTDAVLLYTKKPVPR